MTLLSAPLVIPGRPRTSGECYFCEMEATMRTVPRAELDEQGATSRLQEP